MKRVFWWTVFGISGAALPLFWFGQSVLGQPETKGPAPMVAPQPVDLSKSGELPRPEALSTNGPLPGVQPMTPLPAAPVSLPPTPPSLPMSPADLTPKKAPVAPTTAPRAERPNSLNVPLNVEPGKQQPSVSIEWAGPQQIRINQPMTCQILVRNTSNVPVHNVVIRHQLGQGVVCKSSVPNVASESGDLVWNLGTLAPEQLTKIEIVLVAAARGTMNCHATATFTAVAGHQVFVREPQLTLKMRGPEKAIAGESVTMLITVTNPGDGAAEAIKGRIVMPDGLEHASGRKVIDFDIGNLAPKETRTMQLPCIAKGTGAQKCSITALGDNLTASDAVITEILVPKLDVALTGPKLRYLDRHAVYVLKVTNPGSAPANNVEVQELVPTGFKFHSANHGGTFQESTRLVVWNLGDLQPGQSKDISVDLIPIEAGEHRLIAHVKTSRGLKGEAEARTIVEGLPSLFIEVAHVDDPIEVGAETAYEIRVANTGTKMETNLEVVCTLPEQLEFRGAKCTTTLRYRQEGRELIFEPLPRLAPKADVIYRVQVRGIAPGDIRFRTRIKADGLREPVIREESTRIYSDEAPTRPATTSNSSPVTPSPMPSNPTPVIPPSPGTPVTTPPAPMPVLPAPSNTSPVLPAPSTTAPTPALPTPVVTPVIPSPMPSLPPLPGTSPSGVPGVNP